MFENGTTTIFYGDSRHKVVHVPYAETQQACFDADLVERPDDDGPPRITPVKCGEVLTLDAEACKIVVHGLAKLKESHQSVATVEDITELYEAEALHDIQEALLRECEYAGMPVRMQQRMDGPYVFRRF